MGSRAVVVICRNDAAARERFGITGESGIIYTRTGHRFFNDAELERQILERLRTAMTASGFWEEFKTNWACFDCELMPWSAKAQELLRSQYAAVGAAGKASLPTAVDPLEKTLQCLSGPEAEALGVPHAKFAARESTTEQFASAYRQY